ncbi:nucleotide exchange factor GrpE [Streptomyces sp. NPDC048496]|uniref:nucleotide exchange factor GrpE n=1 Tax=Streptomyces sp. NPDC048496 TaxID=3365558 RepID=UPI0037203EB9
MKQSPQPPRPDLPPLVVVHDRRSTDPVTLRPRRPEGQEATPSTHPAATTGPPVADSHAAHSPSGPENRIRQLEADLAERTADLQRVKAEYDNYRKRVRRDRLAIREAAVANVLAGLLPVLDAIDRARAQGYVTDGFHQVARILESHLAALGLRSVGEAGEPFDPRIHEALTSTTGSGTTSATCTEVLRPGYRVGTHLMRAAQVAVAERPALSPPPHR